MMTDIPEVKVTYQEICSDNDWYIVKIVPITDEEPQVYEFGVSLAPVVNPETPSKTIAPRKSRRSSHYQIRCTKSQTEDTAKRRKKDKTDKYRKKDK